MRRIYFFIFIVASMLSGSAFSKEKDKDIDPNKKNITNLEVLSQFQQLLFALDRYYVHELDNKQEIADFAINGALSSLDPHSSYITDDDLKDLYEHTDGEFGGIGVEVIYDTGVIKVISPIDDLPADKAGIKSGDYIVAVDGDQVNNLGFYKSIKKMKGEPKTNVKLTIVRETEPKPMEFEITRDIVKIIPVKHHVDDDIAYVRITTFNKQTSSELRKVFKNLANDEKTKGKIKGAVLDLRNNAGGLLDQAIEVSEFFIKSGVIVSTKGREESSSVEFTASENSEKAPNIPIVVLINSGTASASEIVSGAIQDYKRGVILGTKSFGKGTVQSIMNVSDRAAIKLTTAKYYTPKGRSIQADGIEPDIIVKQIKVDYQNDDNAHEMKESSLRNYLRNEQKEQKSKKQDEKDLGALKANNDKGLDKDKNDKKHADSKKSQDQKARTTEVKMSSMYYKDYQYARAFDLIKGIIIAKNKL